MSPRERGERATRCDLKRGWRMSAEGSSLVVVEGLVAWRVSWARWRKGWAGMVEAGARDLCCLLWEVVGRLVWKSGEVVAEAQVKVKEY